MLTCLPCFRSNSFRSGPELGTETVLRLTDKEQEFVFESVEARPVPSLLRGFSGRQRKCFEQEALACF